VIQSAYRAQEVNPAKLVLAICTRLSQRMRDSQDKLKLYAQLTQAMNEEIHALMAHCFLFIFQSTCENCPNTLIEALAAGLPIACSSSGVMPEIAGDAAVYFDPFDPDDIGRAIRKIIDDPEVAHALRAVDDLATSPAFEATFKSTLTPFSGGGSIVVPVTVAFGDRDWILLKQWRRRNELPAHTRWVEKHGWGHVPMWVDPVGVSQLILEGTK